LRVAQLATAILSASLALGVALSTSTAAAQESASWGERPEGKLHFASRYPRFRVSEIITTSVAAATAGAFILVPPLTGSSSRNPFDETFRDAFRLSSPRQRITAANVSDVLVVALWLYEAIVDPFAVAWGVHGESATGAQMFLIDAEVQTITAALQGIVAAIVGRQRPLTRDCDDPAETIGLESGACSGYDRHRSFFSGHTSQAFAAAGAQCMHHLHLPLYGNLTPFVPCAASFAVAAMAGGLRIMADRHYMSDVLTGATIGTLVGVLVPWLLHYRHRAPSDEQESDEISARNPFQMFVVPTGLGAAVVGVY
jgi:membrane-associated phospholipid phosphatase